jgi:hypothetical protein
MGDNPAKFGPVADVYDHGVGRRTALGLKQTFDGVGIKRVGPDAVDRFGWKNDELSPAEQVRRFD